MGAVDVECMPCNMSYVPNSLVLLSNLVDKFALLAAGTQSKAACNLHTIGLLKKR